MRLEASGLACVRNGREVFLHSTCVMCHTIQGTTAAARVGPDLTHVASRSRIASEIIPNTPAAMARWLHDPPAEKPGSLMPNLHLSDKDVNALVAYLGTLK